MTSAATNSTNDGLSLAAAAAAKKRGQRDGSLQNSSTLSFVPASLSPSLAFAVLISALGVAHTALRGLYTAVHSTASPTMTMTKALIRELMIDNEGNERSKCVAADHTCGMNVAGRKVRASE